MPAGRASYTIEPEVLSRFNEMVPSGERSKIVEAFMKKALAMRSRQLEAIAEEFVTHPDFAQVRADSALWEEATLSDGLEI